MSSLTAGLQPLPSLETSPRRRVAGKRTLSPLAITMEGAAVQGEESSQDPFGPEEAPHPPGAAQGEGAPSNLTERKHCGAKAYHVIRTYNCLIHPSHRSVHQTKCLRVSASYLSAGEPDADHVDGDAGECHVKKKDKRKRPRAKKEQTSQSVENKPKQKKGVQHTNKQKCGGLENCSHNVEGQWLGRVDM